MGVDRTWHLFRLFSKDDSKDMTKGKKNNKYASMFISNVPSPFSTNHYTHFEDAKTLFVRLK